jgi:hypothetical protein
MRDRVWASEHLADANRVEMRRLPFRHINRRKEETEPLSAWIDRDQTNRASEMFTTVQRR